MSTRVCEYCFNYFATSSEIVAHYRKEHVEHEKCDEIHEIGTPCPIKKDEEGEKWVRSCTLAQSC